LTYTIQATKAGYDTGRVAAAVRTGDSVAQSVVIPLQAVTQAVSVKVQFYPAIPGVEWTLNGQSIQKAGVSYQGGLAQVEGLAPDLFTLTASHPDYEPASQVLKVDGQQRSFVVSLVRKGTGADSAPVGPTPPAVYDPNANPEDLVLGADVSEETYDNSAYQGYFTSAQVRLYIGNLFIDQLHTIQYALQQNNVPLFGYCSEFPDAYGRGRSIIQGQIVVNYVHQGYLYSALRNYERMLTAKAVASTGSQLAKTIKASTRATSADLQAQVAARLTDLLRSATPEEVQQAQDLLRPPAAADPYTNPLYRHTAFDMRLEIGDGPYRSIRLLEKVKLGVNEQICDQSGQVILESYAFMARRLR
jgi:hypothetical protein